MRSEGREARPCGAARGRGASRREAARGFGERAGPVQRRLFDAMTTPRLVAAASALALLTAGCSRSAPPVDLRHVPADRLVEASAAGQDRKTVLEVGERGLRINDVLVRGFAAGPPGRVRFSVDLPKDARLFLTCAIDPRYHDRPGVEFTAKVKKDGRETVVWSQLVDPIAHPEHRGFVNAEVDLARYGGPGRELVLETRGYEETGDPGRALWGAPTVTSTRQKAPLMVVYLVDTLRADHTGVYGYPRKTTPELRRVREGRRRLRRRGGARVVDEAVGRVRPHVGAARAPPRRAAARRARPRVPDDREAPRRARLVDGRFDRELRHLQRGVGVRPGLRRLRGPPRRGRPPQQARRRGRGRRLGPRVPQVAPRPTDVPLRAHDGPPRTVRAARAVRSDVRAAPDGGPPRAGPAHRLQGAARPRADDRAVRRRRRVRRP